ncbi:DNA polymerase epsilon subunit D [Colletotrichum spinosum]|uniref:DNA polymerase epsilon subunit D n=1 Tax=Colletotrichum spinosum TaxID=1347390 RepID=A0A4R8PVL5_9PEZI|nr:DNA polymerase epsilon subunit D [Colletotrichum spinosum]
MPPRKSDASRRSDVSNARFAVMDETPASTPSGQKKVTPASPSTTAPAAAGAESTTPASAGPTSSSTPHAISATPHAASEKKDGEKAAKDKVDKDALSIDDLSLPKSIITRLAKGVLAPNSQIQANAVLAMNKSATVFINYLASHANENTVNANKKTVSAEDVFKALDDIEFGFLREPLEHEFAKYNQIQSAKRSTYRQKVAAKKGGAAAGVAVGAAVGAAAVAASADDSILTTASSEDGNGKVHRAKKARVDESAMSVDEEADDAETEPEDDVNEEEEDEEADEEEEEGEEEEEAEESGDETQDPLEEKEAEGSDVDEALDGDESD